MPIDQMELLDHKLKGYCCSQIIMAAYLKRMEKENPELIEAVGGLCIGSHIGQLCGTLSAAICVITLATGGETRAMCDDLTAWFEDSYGSVQCRDIIGEDLIYKVDICKDVVTDTFNKMEEILDMNGKLHWED